MIAFHVHTTADKKRIMGIVPPSRFKTKIPPMMA
jgi:hypothetical protein